MFPTNIAAYDKGCKPYYHIYCKGYQVSIELNLKLRVLAI